MTTSAINRETQRLPLGRLRLDWRNPRLPAGMQREDASQEELALYIDEHYEPIQIARSIARHGYFESEPLIAIAEGRDAVVVEGNRRLAALMGLADERLRGRLIEQNSGWEEVANDVSLPDSYPVVVVESRDSVVPLLGFRHISGIAPWEPWAQARFIADLVANGQSLEEIAELVGRSLTEIRSMFRDHEILQQAEELFSLNTGRAEENFGVFTAAMSRTKIRDYIAAPPPRDVDAEYWPLPEESKPRVERLLTYMFGDEQGDGRVLHDSRQLKDLAEVLGDESGKAERVLRKSGNLLEAAQAIHDTQSQFRNYINAAARSLRLAKGLDVTTVELPSITKLQEIRRSANALLKRAAEESD